ncbi:MAG: translation elongation factor Ts [Dehalococcoidia bacterium]|nr:translation elongation factor Ts [Dehalococcoidia bacterium]
MTEISVDSIKQLREATGAGIMDCKRALGEAGGDITKASDILRAQGIASAEKKISRAASQGLIEAYIHAGGRIASLIEVNCETDFVARTDAFKDLAHNLAMQVAAMNPRYVSLEDVPAGEEVNPKEACLLSQPFIKSPDVTIRDLIKQHIGILGENVIVRRFSRFELGA